MKTLKLKQNIAGTALAMVLNMLLAYAAYMLCRIAFIAVNWGVLGDGFAELSLWQVLCGALRFDTSAILYTNVLYALMMLLPLHYKEHRVWQRIAKCIFLVVNALAVVVNLADAVYFTFTGRRTTMSVTSEFSNEGNLLSIFSQATVQYWYLVLFGAAVIFGLWRCYVTPSSYSLRKGKMLWLSYYAVQVACLAAFIPLCIGGMRGGMTKAVRPITISNANQYVNHPTEAAMVLNTPFSLIRTMGKSVFVDPQYFTAEELAAVYLPLYNKGNAFTGDCRQKKNVVVLIVESFGREYIGAYNDTLDGKPNAGFTPFVDELMQQSLTYDHTFANGRKSIDGMPSILSSIPHFVEPFFLTPASLNDVSGIAGELSRCGYSTAFFHGAENGSMGFEAFARATGYQKYYGRTEFNADKRFRGDTDFDGTWAIWDEPFLQFYALKMSEMQQPFVTTVFTASSHHPFAIPEEYARQFDRKGEEVNPIHKCIRYTDMALRRFFETARRQPWFRNTIFVLTADHTNMPDHSESCTDIGVYNVPIIIYDPSGKLPRGRRHGVAQQIDIMPTLLNCLGYANPYVAFGKDLLNTAEDGMWAVNYSNGVYQYVKGDYMIQFDGKATIAMYCYANDRLLRRNLVADASLAAMRNDMERELKALVQSYMQRMVNNQLVVRD